MVVDKKLIKLSQFDIIVVKIVLNTAFYKSYEEIYKKDFSKNTKYILHNKRNLKFFYSKSKSIENGLNPILKYTHISIGGLYGLDIYSKRSYINYHDDEWVNNKLNLNSYELKSIPSNIISLLNYLCKSKYNFKYNKKYYGINYKLINKELNKNKKKLIFFTSYCIKKYVYTKYAKLNFEDYMYNNKLIGKYVVQENKIFFSPNFHSSEDSYKDILTYFMDIFYYFKPDQFYSIQTAGSLNKYSLGCLRQSNNIKMIDNMNIYLKKTYKKYFGLSKFYFVRNKNTVINKKKSLFTSNGFIEFFYSNLMNCETFLFSIITDNSLERLLSEKEYEENDILFGKILDKLVFSII